MEKEALHQSLWGDKPLNSHFFIKLCRPNVMLNMFEIVFSTSRIIGTVWKFIPISIVVVEYCWWLFRVSVRWWPYNWFDTSIRSRGQWCSSTGCWCFRVGSWVYVKGICMILVVGLMCCWWVCWCFDCWIHSGMGEKSDLVQSNIHWGGMSLVVHNICSKLYKLLMWKKVIDEVTLFSNIKLIDRA